MRYGYIDISIKLTLKFKVRVYSREAVLDNNHIMHVQKLPAPIVLIAPSGDDSLLVYTYENVLYHYVINVTDATVGLVQVGKIALHGIIRAPPRVRALSWILPEDQISTFRQSTSVGHANKLQTTGTHRRMCRWHRSCFL
jgi:hypothetical protein